MLTIFSLFKKQLHSWRTLCLIALCFTVAACTAGNGPWPMPTGYKYHGANNEFKAPPGPEPELKKLKDKVGVQKSHIDTMHSKPVAKAEMDAGMPPISAPAVNNEAVKSEPLTKTEADWRGPVEQTLSRLFADHGTPTEAVYIKPAGGASAYNAVLEKSLINALKAKNVAVVFVRGEAPNILTYTVTNGGGADLLDLAINNNGETWGAESQSFKSLPKAASPAMGGPLSIDPSGR